MTVTKRVEAILHHVPAARNSDTELQIIYLQKMGMCLTQQQIELLKSAPSMETIRRVRQKIQSEGRYKADPEIQKERFHKSLVMEQTSPAYDAEMIERTLGVKILPWNGG